MAQPIHIKNEQRVIAVLTEINSKEGKKPSFGTIHEFCEELNQLVTDAGDFFYVFSLTGISTQSVTGFYFNGRHWQKGELPLPDVVYNRIHSRRTEAGKRFASFRQMAEKLNIPVFNDRFLAKWEVHQCLTNYRHLLPFLPETKLFNEKTFEEMFAKYEDLYLKPIMGSQGNGIIWVKKNQNQMIDSNRKGMESFQFPTKDELFQALKNKTKNRPYLLQQGISLLTKDGKRLDFRVLCHRKDAQQWEVSSNVARVSAADQFASNLALGGEALRPFHALIPFFGREAASCKLNLMKELALETAECLTRNFPGLLVELGIDIGVDEKGDLWLIEVNSKPSKNMEKKKRTARPSAKAIIRYCQAILGERLEGDGS